MTHTHHRLVESSKETKDFIILAMPAKGINDAQGAEKLKDAFSIMMKYNPVNGGGINAGNLISNTPQEIIATINPETPMIHGVFTNEEDLLAALSAIKQRDLGISIVVTGNINRVEEIAGKISISPHSINFSLGVFGNQKLLPTPDIMEITTMCGHGLISVKLVEKVIDDLKRNRSTLEEASNELGRHCVCGIFNTKRAKEILSKFI